MTKKTKKEETQDVAITEYKSPGLTIDVREHIVIHMVFDGEGTKGWVHTHGMGQFGLPELEMRNVPLFLQPAAGHLMNEVADFMVTSKGSTFKPGQRYGFGPSFFILAKSIPIPGDEGHFQEDRWIFEEVQPECAACAGGKPHKHDEMLH